MVLEFRKNCKQTSKVVTKDVKEAILDLLEIITNNGQHLGPAITSDVQGLNSEPTFLRPCYKL
jgi:hypothetical protein